MQKDLQTQITAISKIDTEQVSRVSDLLSGINPETRKVVVSGMGKAGHIAHNFAMTLCSTGIPAVFLHPSEAQHGDLGVISKHDEIFLISNSGETEEIIQLVELIKKLRGTCHPVILTGNADSRLAKAGFITIVLPELEEICPLGLTPTTSLTCMMVVTQLIVADIMRRREFTKEEYAKRHHSGYLGQKAREE